MQYIKVKFTKGFDGEGYQELFQGRVQRITDLGGNPVLEEVLEYHVIDDEPEEPSWALPDPVQEPAQEQVE